MMFPSLVAIYFLASAINAQSIVLTALSSAPSCLITCLNGNSDSTVYQSTADTYCQAAVLLTNYPALNACWTKSCTVNTDIQALNTFLGDQTVAASCAATFQQTPLGPKIPTAAQLAVAISSLNALPTCYPTCWAPSTTPNQITQESLTPICLAQVSVDASIPACISQKCSTDDVSAYGSASAALTASLQPVCAWYLYQAMLRPLPTGSPTVAVSSASQPSVVSKATTVQNNAKPLSTATSTSGAETIFVGVLGVFVGLFAL
ncbi:hypothetical protein BCR33DRAFT_853762 [Rhizoclosmatium globosum]|uniref:Extracellular membrane protein CFEM domain-containing protein n=1 Tax=Rhizoclosmatium globosum TaxID=329046 RepID=A0A1Y2BVJ4_9FUNG|nr:hypothetical protein BCR33DRAFT_853762 [Rhizoclosmatium globosum]|eukprot:ORY38781.1 hypothetical protein BCR33DRAFT_853762 [Rhizoclosmatium globosum]